MKTLLPGLVSGPLLLGLVLSVQAQIYRWSDEQGHLHFSDRPPPHGDHRPVDPATLPPLHVVQPEPLPAQRPAAPRPAPPASRRPSTTGEVKSGARCDEYQASLRAIAQELRSGYREPRGQQLRNQRRELSTRYHRECR